MEDNIRIGDIRQVRHPGRRTYALVMDIATDGTVMTSKVVIPSPRQQLTKYDGFKWYCGLKNVGSVCVMASKVTHIHRDYIGRSIGRLTQDDMVSLVGGMFFRTKSISRDLPKDAAIEALLRSLRGLMTDGITEAYEDAGERVVPIHG